MCSQTSCSRQQKQWCWQLPNADHILAQFLHFEYPTVYQTREEVKREVEQIYENKDHNYGKWREEKISNIMFLWIYCFLSRIEHQQSLKVANIKQAVISYSIPWYNTKFMNL